MTSKIPECLRSRPQWCLWKTVERGGQKTKLPFQVDNQNAKSNDPATWTTFEQASIRFKLGGYDGLGFFFAESDPFCGIDLDGCRDVVTGKVAPWAVEIIRDLNSYTEVSPSKTGVKIFVEAKSPFATGRKVAVKQPQVCDKLPGIEIYDKLRYFAVTGLRMAASDLIEDRQAELQEVVNKYFPDEPTQSAAPAPDWHSNDAIVERARKYMLKVPPAVSGNSGHNATYKAACILVCGFGLSEVDASQLLREWNQTCDPPWTENELAHKLKDAARATGERNYLRNIAPANWQQVKIPEYQPPAAKEPPKPSPTVLTLEQATRNYVECIREGTAKATPLGLDSLDLALGGGVEYGEMVILAARPSHGKSAVAMQMIHHATKQQVPCLFISEEMAALALGKRVIHYATDIPSTLWATEVADVEAAVDAHFKPRSKCFVTERCASAEVAAETARKFVKEHGVRFIVIDYVQILEGKGKDRYSQVTNTSVVIRQLANETKAVVLALCQLNRAIENRGKFIPQSSDLRESGQLEQDADVVIGMVWPWKIDNTQNKAEYQFHVLKNRNRPIHQPMVTCQFDAARQTMNDANPFDVVMYDNNGKMTQGAFSAFAEQGGY